MGYSGLQTVQKMKIQQMCDQIKPSGRDWTMALLSRRLSNEVHASTQTRIWASISCKTHAIPQTLLQEAMSQSKPSCVSWCGLPLIALNLAKSWSPSTGSVRSFLWSSPCLSSWGLSSRSALPNTYLLYFILCTYFVDGGRWIDLWHTKLEPLQNTISMGSFYEPSSTFFNGPT